MMPPGWRCPRRTGFLFPHPCSRLTPEGCPDCQNGQVSDPYTMRRDRYYYSGYDSYDTSLTAYALESLAGNFTEADGESLVTPQDDSPDTFENNLSES